MHLGKRQNISLLKTNSILTSRKNLLIGLELTRLGVNHYYGHDRYNGGANLILMHHAEMVSQLNGRSPMMIWLHGIATLKSLPVSVVIKMVWKIYLMENFYLHGK